MKPFSGFLRTPDLEFSFFLAQKLGMTVAEMNHRMATSEFVEWKMYYARKAQREELETLKAKAKRGRGR